MIDVAGLVQEAREQYNQLDGATSWELRQVVETVPELCDVLEQSAAENERLREELNRERNDGL